jgi:ribosomal peptide maturation radical SAM protein 1
VKPVALVSMPVCLAACPSYQLGLLTALLRQEGFCPEPFSFFHYFASIGRALNEALAEPYHSGLTGEWVWAKAAFGDFGDSRQYLARYEGGLAEICRRAKCSVADILHVRNRCSFAFLDYCLKAVDWHRFGVIGFSIAYQQLLASLALARRLKKLLPELPILFGGPIWDQELAEEIVRACPYVDCIHCGDADSTIGELVLRLSQRQNLRGLPGLVWREQGCIVNNGRAPAFRALDSSPIPNYDEFFRACTISGFAKEPAFSQVWLPMETSRGCWWGAKSQCVFCGSDPAGLPFRSKAPELVIRQMRTLARRYQCRHLVAIDKAMDPRYVRQVFTHLRRRRAKLKIHYMLRSTLSRPEIQILHQGGLCSVLPGVESFSTHLLNLMHKGIEGIQNLQFLKSCAALGIDCRYFLLYGFAGETAGDYDQQIKLIPRIQHFQPPTEIMRARAHRASPMFRNPSRYSVSDLRPYECYQFLFPTPQFDLRRVGYYLEHTLTSSMDPDVYARFYNAAELWQKAWRKLPRPTLTYQKLSRHLLIRDGRGATVVERTFPAPLGELYEFCTDVRAPQAIHEHFDHESWIEPGLRQLLDNDLMVFWDDAYLSLALSV